MARRKWCDRLASSRPVTASGLSQKRKDLVAHLARRTIGSTSVSRKILASVSVAVLAGVAVGVVGAVALDRGAEKAGTTYRQSTQALEQAEEMRAQLLQLQLDHTAALLPNTDANVRKTWADGATAAARAFADAGEAYLATAPTAPQEELAQRALGDYQSWSQAYAT